MDAHSHIRQALKRSAILQLKRILAREMQERPEMSSRRWMDEDGFLWEMLNTPSASSQAIRGLITIIHGCTHQLLTCQDPSLSPSNSEKVAKEQTRKIIMNIIRIELNNLQNDVLPSSNQDPQIKINEEDVNLNVSPPASLSPSVLEEAFSPRHDAYQSESLAIQSFPEPIVEEAAGRQQYSQQQWRQTKEQALHSGHFLLGDKMASIRKLIVFSGQICGVVEWKQRGLQTPGQSIMEIATIREHAPRELGTFLEKQAAFYED